MCVTIAKRALLQKLESAAWCLMLSVMSCLSRFYPVRANALLCPCYSICQGQPHAVKPCKNPVQVAQLPGPATLCDTLQNSVQLARLHTGMGQPWRQLRTQQQCLGSRPASTSMTRGYWGVPGSRRPALLSSRSSSESWLSATLSSLMVPSFPLLLLPSVIVMHACHNILYLCPRHRSACVAHATVCTWVVVTGWPVVTYGMVCFCVSNRVALFLGRLQ